MELQLLLSIKKLVTFLRSPWTAMVQFYKRLLIYTMACLITAFSTFIFVYSFSFHNDIRNDIHFFIVFRTQIGEVSLSASFSSNQSKKENIAQEICFENNISQNLLNVAEEKIVGDRCATVVKYLKIFLILW